MILSLREMCITTISKYNMKNIYNKLPSLIYIEYVNYLMDNNLNIWKEKMKLINLEVNIKDIEVELDMYFDQPTYHIFVKKKISNYHEGEYDRYYGENGEYILYHEFSGDHILYDNYYKIVESRNLINNNYDLDINNE